MVRVIIPMLTTENIELDLSEDEWMDFEPRLIEFDVDYKVEKAAHSH